MGRWKRLAKVIGVARDKGGVERKIVERKWYAMNSCNGFSLFDFRITFKYEVLHKPASTFRANNDCSKVSIIDRSSRKAWSLYGYDDANDNRESNVADVEGVNCGTL